MSTHNSYQYDELLELENFMNMHQKRQSSAPVPRPQTNKSRTQSKPVNAQSPKVIPRIRGNNNVVPENAQSQIVVTKSQVRKPTSVPIKSSVEEYDELQVMKRAKSRFSTNEREHKIICVI